MAPGDARQNLLEAAIDHVANHGLTDWSLRQLATELGTSHRMLIHHFGSKQGLWVAIVHEVERRQLEILQTVVLEPSLSPEDSIYTSRYTGLSSILGINSNGPRVAGR